MANVQLVDDPRQDDFSSSNTPLLDVNCDCACPVDELDIPTLDMPTFYSLELTPSCNNRCPGCSNVFFSDLPNRIMAPARRPMRFRGRGWREVLARIAPNATRLKITGGEATMHPEFELIISEVERRGISFTLFTNARFQHPERMVSFLRTKKSCAGLLISLHGRQPKRMKPLRAYLARSLRRCGLPRLPGLPCIRVVSLPRRMSGKFRLSWRQ